MAMPRPSHLTIGTFTFAVVCVSAIAGAALSKPTDATVKFTATGPAGLKIEGATSALNVAEDGINVTVTVPLTTLHTGIDIRDKHMKEDLEVEKFPEAQLI